MAAMGTLAICLTGCDGVTQPKWDEQNKLIQNVNGYLADQQFVYQCLMLAAGEVYQTQFNGVINPPDISKNTNVTQKNNTGMSAKFPATKTNNSDVSLDGDINANQSANSTNNCSNIIQPGKNSNDYLNEARVLRNQMIDKAVVLINANYWSFTAAGATR